MRENAIHKAIKLAICKRMFRVVETCRLGVFILSKIPTKKQSMNES